VVQTRFVSAAGGGPPVLDLVEMVERFQASGDLSGLVPESASRSGWGKPHGLQVASPVLPFP
jgi:hypothetical protein